MVYGGCSHFGPGLKSGSGEVRHFADEFQKDVVLILRAAGGLQCLVFFF